MSSEVLAEKRGNLFWLTINREDRRNALNPDVMKMLGDGIIAARTDPDVRVIIITGAGEKAFCAGADLQKNATTFAFDYGDPRAPFGKLTRIIMETDVPIVARVNGTCMAGGMGLLGLCDLAVATETAKFGLPEVKIGLFPMMILTTLKSIMQPRDLRELCITGEPVNAHRAKEIGLVNHVYSPADFGQKFEEFIGCIVDKSPTAIRRGKYALRAVDSMTMEQTIAFAETTVPLAVLTEDFKEGQAAFNEKRKPQWTNR